MYANGNSKTNRTNPAYFNIKNNINGRRGGGGRIPYRTNGNKTDNSDTNSTNSTYSRDSPQLKEETKCILVTNLNRQTVPGTLRDYFIKFERVEKVNLNVDNNENLTGSATITFSRIPKDLPNMKLVGKHAIDGRSVRVQCTRDTSSDDYGTYSRRIFETSRLYARTLSMGTMIGPKHFVEEWSTSNQVKYVLQYTQRRVNIFFSHLDSDYKMEYKFKDVFGDMRVERENYTTTLTIPLRYPATFWKRNYKSIQETKRSISVGEKWERVILIPLTPDADITSRPTSGLTPIQRTDVINIGNWKVLRLIFCPQQKYASGFEAKLKEAADFNLVPRDLSMLKPFITVTKASELPKPWGHVEREKLNLSFDVLYLLESIISYHYFNEYNMTENFYKMLKQLDPAISCGFLQLISTAKQQVYDPTMAFQKIWDSMGMKVKDQRNIPSHCAMLRKVIVTPSHLYIQPPSLETTNRVVRHYREHSDRFIRVQFMDEGFNKVSGAKFGVLTKEVLYNRIFDVLKRGIQIGSRRYEFLAFSSSQLREQGCWFFAPTADLNSDMIRNWMGVFSHEKVVAKHAVRMGQCFSSTRPVCSLQENEVSYIKDIVHNGYTFSDGVGKIAPALAEEVAIQMDLKMVPSAFQFRLGGAKGVLTVDKDLAGGNVKVQLRPSQIKFESKHLTLEVIRTSTYIHGYLNRQIITLLSSLGVKDEVFMELMDNMLHDIDKMFQRAEEAVRVLLGNVDEAGTVTDMVTIIQAGFLERKDPYIINLLNLFRVNILKDLKKKAKIIVPQGAYLLGVMDETNTLEEGEVFVQINDTSNNGSHKQVITGEVVVFRNPCFHPGDIRVVNAVDRPNLHHLIDVVVFSAKGFRDIPSMCSGGDLDGDDYTVYWDPKLLPVKKNFTPMDYIAAQPNLVEDVKIRDIIKFFVNYINYDNLGMIANTHLATADLSANGARDGKCILLAQLHSEAVDFPKSGKPAHMTEDLEVKTYPDFMQKKDKETYESKKVLGRIFRAIDKSDYKDYTSKLENEAIYDPRLRVLGMELYIKEARESRLNYNRNLSALMNQFGVQTEAEIVSMFIIKWLKKGKSKTTYEQHQFTMKAVKSFKTLWRKEFEQEFYDAKKQVDFSQRNKIDAKAAAWYYVTYHPEERQRDFSVEGGFLSFPWCIHEYICAIAKRNTHKGFDDPKLYQAIDEVTIQDGAEKLRQDRGNTPFVFEASDDEDEPYGVEYDTDASSDDEVFTYRANPNIYRTNGGAAAAAAIADNTGRTNNSNLINTNGNINPITARPLEAHQSMVSADAPDTDLEDALFG